MSREVDTLVAAQNILEFISDTGTNVRQLARSSGVHENTIFNLLKGRQTRISSYELIAHFMGVPLWSLFYPKGWRRRQVILLLDTLEDTDLQSLQSIFERISCKMTESSQLVSQVVRPTA